MDVLFNISVYRVNEADFRSCDLRRGVPITAHPQSGEFMISEIYLKRGNNYFIGKFWSLIM